MRITGIILAGGKNSRMGTPKAFLKVNGSRLIDKILAVYREIFAEIIIVTNNPAAYLEFHDTAIVADIYDGKGALGGIYTGLFYATTEYSFVTACDMPFLNRDFLRYVTGKAGKHDVIVYEHDGGYEPLHALYSQKCLLPIKRLLQANELKITGFYKGLRLMKISPEKIKQLDPHGRLFLNINTPEELRRAGCPDGDANS
ncbi:MAG TPA: molybdenum cofactor guanylyltransferase [Smithellaceae bacterium]|nr:molybdenum cofactor guanylyltransferase [Smithellaceae bacterium]